MIAGGLDLPLTALSTVTHNSKYHAPPFGISPEWSKEYSRHLIKCKSIVLDSRVVLALRDPDDQRHLAAGSVVDRYLAEGSRGGHRHRSSLRCCVL